MGGSNAPRHRAARLAERLLRIPLGAPMLETRAPAVAEMKTGALCQRALVLATTSSGLDRPVDFERNFGCLMHKRADLVELCTIDYSNLLVDSSSVWP